MKILEKWIYCTSFARANACRFASKFARANDSAGLHVFARASANYISLNLQFARASARPIFGRAPNPTRL